MHYVLLTMVNLQYNGSQQLSYFSRLFKTSGALIDIDICFVTNCPSSILTGNCLLPSAAMRSSS